MSGFGRGGKGGGHGGRGGGSIAALRRGMAKNHQLVHKPARHNESAMLGLGSTQSSAHTATEESYQLACNPHGSSQFAMMIRLTPGLLDGLRRVESQGGSSCMKFGVHPPGHLIKVGQEEYKFHSAPEQGELCDIYEEQRGCEDGQGVLTAAGSAWRKISVQRTLSASEKDRVKKRSVEAEQQLKSRKAIVLDSSLMKPEGTPGGDVGRRPPVKAKKEPPPKKRKVTTTTAAPSKPKITPVPKEKTAPPTTTAPVVTETTQAHEPVPSTSPPNAQVHHSQQVNSGQQANAIPQVNAVQQVNPIQPVNLEKEEISIGGSPPPNKPVQKEKVATPDIKRTPLNPTDLRNNIIVLLTDNPRGLRLKDIEKSLGDPGRKNIEKILKSIATYQAPGKYLLKPGIKPDFTRPSPASSSLPAVDSPESPVVGVESKNDPLNNKLPSPEKEPEPAIPNTEIERIDVGYEESPVKEATPINEVEHKQEEAAQDEEMAATENQVGTEDAHASASSSGSESDSDSDSGSSSDSESSESGSTASGSSSDEEEEDIDIVGEDEKTKAKPDSERNISDEFHKESEEIDIGDTEVSKLDAVVEKITETIPLEVDVISMDEQGGEMNVDIEDHQEQARHVEEIEVGGFTEESPQPEKSTSDVLPEERKPRDDIDRGEMDVRQPREESYRVTKSDESAKKQKLHKKEATELPRSREDKRQKVSSRPYDDRSHVRSSKPDGIRPSKTDGWASQTVPTRNDQRDSGARIDSEKVASENDNDLELGEFRETTPEQRSFTRKEDASRVKSNIRPVDTRRVEVGREPFRRFEADNKRPEVDNRRQEYDAKRPESDIRRPVTGPIETRRPEADTGRSEIEKRRPEALPLDTKRPEADTRRSEAGPVDTRRPEAAPVDTRRLEAGSVDTRRQESGRMPEVSRVEHDSRRPEVSRVEHDSRRPEVSRVEHDSRRPEVSRVEHDSRRPEVSRVEHDSRRPEVSRVEHDSRRPEVSRTDVRPEVKKAVNHHDKGVTERNAKGGPLMKKGSSISKENNSSADSIQSKGTDFFAPYEKDAPELRGPIKDYEQYKEYMREYNEKYQVYLNLNSCLETDRESFEGLQRDLEHAKSMNDKNRLASVYNKVTQDYMHCHKRFKRMAKTFLILHEELRTIKERCIEYARHG